MNELREEYVEWLEQQLTSEREEIKAKNAMIKVGNDKIEKLREAKNDTLY